MAPMARWNRSFGRWDFRSRSPESCEKSITGRGLTCTSWWLTRVRMCPEGSRLIHISTLPRRAVLVLGMHRSGTSAVAGLLAHCGLQPPRTLLPADRFNARGYWESAVFMDFHDRLLLAAGTRWDAYTRIDPVWLASETAARFKDECRTLLAHEFGSAPQFVLKDNRICRLLQLWMDLLDTES